MTPEERDTARKAAARRIDESDRLIGHLFRVAYFVSDDRLPQLIELAERLQRETLEESGRELAALGFPEFAKKEQS